MPKCDFIEITLRYGCFSCKFAAYFQQTFPQTSKDVSQLTHVVVRRHVGVETKPCIYWVAVVLATTLSNKRWFLRHFTIHLSLIIKLVTVNIKVCSIGL